MKKNLKIISFLKITAPTCVIFTGIGALLAYGPFLSYASKSLIAAPFSISEFKAVSDRTKNLQNFESYLSHRAKAKSDAAQYLEIIEERSASIIESGGQWLAPVLRISKKETKDFIGDISKTNDGADIVGYQITTSAKSPEMAQAQTALLADYIADSNLRESLIEKNIKDLGDHRFNSKKIAAENAQDQFTTQSLERRLDELKRIADAYPSASKISEGPKSNTAKNSNSNEAAADAARGEERFAPIYSQIVAVEVEIVDIKERLARSELTLRQAAQEQILLTAHKQIIHSSASGKQMLAMLDKDTNQRLEAAAQDYDKSTFLNYLNGYAAIKLKYSDGVRFITQPSLASKPKISPRLVIAGFFLLGLLASLAILFRKQLLVFLRNNWSDDQPPRSVSPLRTDGGNTAPSFGASPHFTMKSQFIAKTSAAAITPPPKQTSPSYSTAD